MSNLGAPQPGQSGIQVTTKAWFLAFLFKLIFKPVLSLDGGPGVKNNWGDTFIPCAPGRHAVSCWVPYLYLRHMGQSTIEVDVPPGASVHVRWKVPWLIYLKGKWKIEP